MESVKKDINRKELTVIERSVRNSIIWRLSSVGFTVNTISNIMGTTQSTVSRIIDKRPSKSRIMDSVLFGDNLGGE